MQEIQINSISESENHLYLKLYAKMILLNKGFNDKEILFEQSVLIGKKRFEVDVVGIKENFQVAIECGNISHKNKIPILETFFDEVIHIPYLTKNIYDQLLKINIEELLKPKNIEIETKQINLENSSSSIKNDIDFYFLKQKILNKIDEYKKEALDYCKTDIDHSIKIIEEAIVYSKEQKQFLSQKASQLHPKLDWFPMVDESFEDWLLRLVKLSKEIQK